MAAGNALRVSSTVLSNQREGVDQQVAGIKNKKKLLAVNPLIDDSEQKLVPNVTRVFRPGQKVFVFLEVYDPTIPASLPENFRMADVEASLALYSGEKKVFESPPVRASRLSTKREGVVPVWLQVPLLKIEPGKYKCQVNLIDEFGRKFAFPRTELAVVSAGPS